MNKQNRSTGLPANAEGAPLNEESKSNLILDKKLSRRDMLRLTGATSLGLLLGGGGVGGIMAARNAVAEPTVATDADSIPFTGVIRPAF